MKRILEARLALVTAGDDKSTPVRLFEDTALQKIAKSVAGISGDARKALDVARRTLDRVALRTESGEGGKSGAEGVVRCTIQDATAAYNEMTKTGPGFFVKRLSFHEKVILLALAQCIRRAGVPEVELDAVSSHSPCFPRPAVLQSHEASDHISGLVLARHLPATNSSSPFFDCLSLEIRFDDSRRSASRHEAARYRISTTRRVSESEGRG